MNDSEKINETLPHRRDISELPPAIQNLLNDSWNDPEADAVTLGPEWEEGGPGWSYKIKYLVED